MLNENMLQAVIDEINKANTIAIISHVNIDGDTMGAGLALFKALGMYAKKAYIFCDDVIPRKLTYLSGHEAYNKQSLNKYDLAIAVDASSYDRLGQSAEEFDKAKRTICIDHHVTNERYANVNLIYDCAATCQIIYSLIDNFKLMSKDIATLLMCGIVTDSGIFSYSSVTSETLEVASKLMNYNVNLTDICEKVFKQVSINAFKLRSKALNGAKYYADDRVAIATIMFEDFLETNTTQEHTEGIVSQLRDIEGVDVAVAIAQVATKGFKISFRTSEKVDASRIAMVFGGGGHVRASGCRLNGYYEDVLEKTLKAVTDELC